VPFKFNLYHYKLGDAVAKEDEEAHELSERLLARVRRTGSLLEEELPGEEDRLTLFDDSDSD
jgi:hypothetical protein